MRKTNAIRAVVIFLSLLVISGCSQNNRVPDEPKQADTNRNSEISSDKEEGMIQMETRDYAQLDYLGHASIRIITKEGIVIYVDPYYGKDYNEPADIILITHGHGDHNQIGKIKNKNENCKIISWKEALMDGQYQSFEQAGVKIQAVAAYNKNHSKDSSVGFVLEFDGIKLYHAGDTSKIEEMKELADLSLTYALLPMDNVYNMGPQEATEAAELIQAKYYIPVHTGPDGVFSEENIEQFTPKGKTVVKPKESIQLGE
jgi:L-ascorbate metabolism protein UlaG (beta-lactamase superfamily)